MENKKLYNMNWKDLEKKIDLIVKQIPEHVKAVYGIPRGGLMPAVMISHRTGLPLYSSLGTKGFKEILIIDDIFDSGKTMQKYIDKGYTCATLVTKNPFKVIYGKRIAENVWVQFPWETVESSKIDYLA